VAVKHAKWTPLDEQLPIFSEVSALLFAPLAVLGSAWKWWIGGPCRDRTYDQLIKRVLAYHTKCLFL
jgi:hypothetical protein